LIQKEERILGLDLGEKRIGVAVSDPLHIIAQGLPTIQYDKFEIALERISDIIREYSVSKIVVGLPVTMRGEIGPMARRTLEQINFLKATLNIPVETIDERLTSRSAEQTLRDLGKSPSRNKAKIDELAASFILQTYLDGSVKT